MPLAAAEASADGGGAGAAGMGSAGGVGPGVLAAADRLVLAPDVDGRVVALEGAGFRPFPLAISGRKGARERLPTWVVNAMPVAGVVDAKPTISNPTPNFPNDTQTHTKTINTSSHIIHTNVRTRPLGVTPRTKPHTKPIQPKWLLLNTLRGPRPALPARPVGTGEPHPCVAPPGGTPC